MDTQRLQKLLDHYVDEALTDEELSEMEMLLLSSPQARSYFWEYVRFHALIRRLGEESWGERLARPSAPKSHEETWQSTRETKWPWNWTLAALTCCIALLIYLLFPMLKPTHEPTSSGMALLVCSVDATWEGAKPHAIGAILHPSWLKLKSGYAEIEFYDGARVLLEGPAQFQILSAKEGFLQSGKLSVQVPTPAYGFTIHSPKLELVDLGTAFGMIVHPNTGTEVHVFEGKVEISRTGGAPPKRQLMQGEAIRLDGTGTLHELPANRDLFATPAELQRRAATAMQHRYEGWLMASLELRKDPSLAVYYPFERDLDADRKLKNLHTAAPIHTDGAIIGAQWTSGRWAQKAALEFKSLGDRVRFNLPGEFQSVTLATWVRVDSLDHSYSSLMMCDGYETGGLHWQISREGSAALGVQGYKNAYGPTYSAPAIFKPERLGQWIHLAVVYDATAHQVAHFVDGAVVSREALKLETPLHIGNAELGNWNIVSPHSERPIRNFNGRMDEFVIFSRALAEKEVQQLFNTGSPRS